MYRCVRITVACCTPQEIFSCCMPWSLGFPRYCDGFWFCFVFVCLADWFLLFSLFFFLNFLQLLFMLLILFSHHNVTSANIESVPIFLLACLFVRVGEVCGGEQKYQRKRTVCTGHATD